VIGELGPGRIRAARIVAFLADAVQLGAFPLFAEGAASPWNDALDVVVAAVMVGLVGWHWAFLPTLVAESVPFLDLVPSWTAAVFLATRRAPPAITVEPPRPEPVPRELPRGQ
jgi:hypothetical protein